MTKEQHTIAFKQELSDYSNKLLSRLCVQWKNVSFCDMFIVTRNKHLPVHACVMSAFSSRVYDHISKSSGTFMGRKLSPPYIMKVEFSYEVIDTIVRALYTGVFCPPASVLPEVYAAVEWLDIFELSELLKNNFGRSPLGQASEEENMDPAVNTGTQVEAETHSDYIGDYGGSVNVPGYIITWDAPIKDLSTVSGEVSVESNNQSVKKIRKTARKPKSMPQRYNPEQFILHGHEKVSGKSCSGENLSTSPTAELDKAASHPENKANLRTAQKELDMNPVTPFKEKQSFTSIDSPGQTFVSDRSEVENCKSSTAKSADGITTTQGVSEKNQVLSHKPKKKKSVASQDHEVIVKTEIPDTDPVMAEIDFLIADIYIKKCEKCFVKFSSLEMYIAHITDHPVFTCHDCGEVFYRRFDHTKHQRDKHLGRPYLQCRLCGHQAKNEVECRSHSDEIHGERKPFVCSEEGCGFRARRYVSLHLHMKLHSDEKEFCCEKCGQRFTQFINLKSHHKSCYRLSSFLCDLCGQSFNHQPSMKIHRRTMHLQEKPYHCKVCSRQFTHHSNLKRHMRIHNNIFPYSCPVCKQPFRHSNTLRGHMSSKHKNAESFPIVINSDPSNRLGGLSYKREMKSGSVSKVLGTMAGGGGKRRKSKRDRKGSRFAASPPRMFQTSSLSEGDALLYPGDGQFIIDGIDLDEDVMSNSNPLDSLDTKQLDLSGGNGTVDMDNDHFNNLLNKSSLYSLSE